MSKAGIQSNRGDGYQTLVALDLALTVLLDPDYQWIEVDSVSTPVDDVVIGKASGKRICCQCKKNQPLHKSWSFSDLEDELQKAINLLAEEPNAEVRFYSRDSFGDLKALKEFSASFPDAHSYQAHLTKAHRAIDSQLHALLQKQGTHLTTYHVLQCITFEISPELERMQELLKERLRVLVNQHDVAFDALWRRLDQLGMRAQEQGLTVAAQHRLTKNDLKELLLKSGSLFVPPVEIQRIRSSFEGTSSIGRSWCREIGPERLPIHTVHSVIEAIKEKRRSILLTGQPGSGKTCVMLSVQEELERYAQEHTDLQPLFIQAREFADLPTAQERQAQGLDELWVEEVARFADETHVVVLIDSLDVLSIAREHTVLSYFLAQIDRLTKIPNVTVVTACREFDSRYDRRIAQRQWEEQISCQPLDWATEIIPLLNRLGIETSNIEPVTQELLCNPRELALFVELAQQGGSFNIVTSQSLATCYLNTIVEDNPLLGRPALEALEKVASAMLVSRSLSLPPQRLDVSDQTARTLLSCNILHERQDKQLEFGHQTLLDVLVISGAKRDGVTLNAFIQQLPPVPFVRPTIRNFVEQIANGDRREFRKQIRAVLIGNHAFHIRRLVAETYAERPPHDDDWSMLRELRNQNRDVFQAIYSRASSIEWHHFWMRNLVPHLKLAQDFTGLVRHAYQVSRWKIEDTSGVLAFWLDTLSEEFNERGQLVHSLADEVIQFPKDRVTQCTALIEKLLEMPISDHSFVGSALAYGIQYGGLCASKLWGYIAGDIQDQDLLSYNWEDKLRCSPHEFGNNDDSFLPQQLKGSTKLLELVVSDIERWSTLEAARYKDPTNVFRHGFLDKTSYEDAHSEQDLRYNDSMRSLMNAVEAAILQHSKEDSVWWRANQERICLSHEGALRYFGLLACTTAPENNLGMIGRIVSEPKLYSSALAYELGTLIQAAYIHLAPSAQDTVVSNILSIREEDADNPERRRWMIQKQAEMSLAVPCHMRTTAILAIMREHEKARWPLLRKAEITSWGGTVCAPFSYQVLLDADDKAVRRLLSHYHGYNRHYSDEFLVGGESEVGHQLSIAASYQPIRFLRLLSNCWEELTECFRDDILNGCANHLAYRFGNLRPSDSNWAPLEVPEGQDLAGAILDELECRSQHWMHKRSTANAIESCAHVVSNDSDRVISIANTFLSLQEENSSVSGDSVDWLTKGISMRRGRAAEAMVILANQLEKTGIPWPGALADALKQWASDQHQAIRAVILRRLPYLQSRYPELGWALFEMAMSNSTHGLWKLAERCLYYAYYYQYELVAPYLQRLRHEGEESDLEIWGRLSALCAMANHITYSDLLMDLKRLGSASAWRGASGVWTHSGNIKAHSNQCFTGLEYGLSTQMHIAKVVAQEISGLFRSKAQMLLIPHQLLEHYFSVLSKEEEQHKRELWGFSEWLNATSQHDPMLALSAAELYLAHIQSSKGYLYDRDHHFTQFLTRLFAEAEEQEELDDGQMLHGVVALQDVLLALGVRGIDDWLKAAERP
ncbi:TPA: ATP-binding protein [Vibrio alginolyticus]|uniref:ATP-binding protein n=1 Tax=Vibrio alginolyticus TaxID=663 RepID=UPI00215E7B1C|nr:ATP-binding protein [Vibrio alginolyticus]MCS0223025.1 ATP-binding protein [Vibrio alginolyticus]